MLDQIFIEKDTGGEVKVNAIFEEDGYTLVQFTSTYCLNVGGIMGLERFLNDFERTK